MQTTAGEPSLKSPVPVERKTQIDARSFKPGCVQDTYTTEWYHDVMTLLVKTNLCFNISTMSVKTVSI